MTALKSTAILTAVVSTLAVIDSTAYGIVRHPDGYENVTGSPAGPSQWYAKYNGNASGIIVSPNQILTTIHQGGGAGSSIVVPTGPNAGSYTELGEVTFGSNVDLRLVTVNANFSTWASLYAGNPVGKTMVVGGFGPTRNSIDVKHNGNQLYGYGWGPTAGNNNPLTFGQQYINATTTQSGTYNGTSILTADFDLPENPPLATYPGGAYQLLGSANKVDYEAGFTDGDSGGGWFVDIGGGVFQLAGLTEAAALQRMDSNGTLTNYVGGVGDPVVVFGSSINAVNVSAFNSTLAPLITLPEPTSIGLLALGGLGLMRRNRK